MNKRQKKKRLKQQTDIVSKQTDVTELELQQADEKKEEVKQADAETEELKQIAVEKKELKQDDSINMDLEPLVIHTDKLEQSESVKTDKPEKVTGMILPMMIFPIAFLLMEITMACSTKGQFFSRYGVYITLFCMGYGLLFQLITTLTKWERMNQILQVLSLLGTSILFCIIYFLYCEFQLFYDLNTMLAGASDAMGDFTGDIISMVLTPDGIMHIVLFLLPLLVYIIIYRKLRFAKPTTWKTKGMILGVSIFILFANVGCILLNKTDKNVYDQEYNYGSAVSNFGLLTGIRLEVKQALTDNPENVSFETVATMESSTEELEKKSMEVIAKNEINETTTEEEIPVGKNEVNLDFKALAEKDNGAYAALDEYVSSLQASSKNEYTGLFEGKNLIFLTAEAFTEEAIDKKMTPTLYRLANKGIQFTDFYQPAGAGTTGGEYSNIFGMLPTDGGNSMKKTATRLNWTTLASRLSEKGYYGKAYHNNDYKFYDRDKTHINLGFSDGYEGVGNGLENVITSQWPESDLEMFEGTMSAYIKKEPFFIYYMTVSGHSLYSFGKNAMAGKHKEEVEHLDYSEPVKAYIACQLELEAALTYLMEQLERLNMMDDTVIVISPDHFPYGLDQDSGSMGNLAELYGQPIKNDFIRDHNRLIIWSGCLEKESPIVVDTPTSSIDILPTLCNLFAVEFDSRLLPGRDVFSDAQPLVFTLNYDWKTEKGTYFAGRGEFVPAREGDEISEEYIDNMKTIVKNKITYSRSALQQDYFRHLFGTEE